MNKKLKIIIPIGVLLFLGIGVAIGYVWSEKKEDTISGPKGTNLLTDSLVVLEPILRYGFNEDSFQIYDSEVKKNENLSDILIRYGLEYKDIYAIANASKGIFDVRKFRMGNKYTMFCKKDTSEALQLMIYEVDNTDYIIFDLRDSVSISRMEKEITSERKTASGTIESSLYQTLVDNNINPIVAIELSSIFAWQIDFYHLQKGDQFKVIFHEDFVEDKSIGVKDIEAAYFKHYDSSYYALYFEQDSIGDYYNSTGKSLRSQFLKTPLEFGRLTSAFTYKRFHPVQKRWKAHLGTDFAAPRGTPIRVTGSGVVTEASYTGGNGRYVKVRHNGTYSTQYLHMSRIGEGIRPGVHVKQGQTIGYVGSTGLATGPHVCYRFWKNGKQVDPKREKFPASKPVRPEYVEQFDSVKTMYMEQLDKVPFVVGS